MEVESEGDFVSLLEHAGFGIFLSGVSKKGFQQNKWFLVCWGSRDVVFKAYVAKPCFSGSSK